MTKSQKKSTYRKGILSEYWVLLYLWIFGHKILSHRYKTHVGEIDIVSLSKDTVVFTEVKYRSTLIDGLESVTPKAQKRIRNAAHLFLKKHPKLMGYNMRFDVVVVFKHGKIRKIRNAF